LCLLHRTKQDIVLLTTPVLACANHNSMRKGQTKGKRGLSKLVATKITQVKYAELTKLAGQTKGETISSVLRKILDNRPVKTFRHDDSLDLVMEELAANRAEIRSIGVNINQMAKLFNTYPELRPKVFYARNGYERFLQIEKNIDKLLAITEKLAVKWLSA
jgi:hypothetical protein